VEGRGCDMRWGTMPYFAQRDWSKLRNTRTGHSLYWQRFEPATSRRVFTSFLGPPCSERIWNAPSSSLLNVVVSAWIPSETLLAMSVIARPTVQPETSSKLVYTAGDTPSRTCLQRRQIDVPYFVCN